jgi:hypothetical protein
MEDKIPPTPTPLGETRRNHHRYTPEINHGYGVYSVAAILLSNM